MTRWAIVAAVLTATSALATHTEGLGFKIVNNDADPFEFWVDNSVANPGGLTNASVQNASIRAFETWEEVACASTAFEFKGLTQTNPAITNPKDARDAFNVAAIWITSAADPYYELALGPTTLAAALVLSHQGLVYQCDVYVNGVDEDHWATGATTAANETDLQSVLLHEAGHCQGLGHTSNPADVMYTRYSSGVRKRALSTHDKDTLCTMYPTFGTVGSPCQADGGCTNALDCVRPPKSDGGFFPRMCSRGCNAANDSCPAPYLCVASTLISGESKVCLPEDNVLRIGDPCDFDADCGDSPADCLPQNSPPLPSGETNWADGYCSRPCGAANPCPTGTECAETDHGNRCVKHCNDDCRAGYGCSSVNDGPRVCVPKCGSDADCEATHVCRPCDGLCVARQNPGVQIGTACTEHTQCGTGQQCLKFGESTQGVCTQTCGKHCSVCPAGSACHPLGEDGIEYCLKECSTGTCPDGLMCSQLPTGKGCLLSCVSDDECPVGNTCTDGECINPYVGQCQLCGADGGPDISNDGGTGGPNGQAACGCQVTAVEAWLSLALAMMWPWLRGRKSQLR